jgi:hypothetical protein
LEDRFKGVEFRAVRIGGEGDREFPLYPDAFSRENSIKLKGEDLKPERSYTMKMNCIKEGEDLILYIPYAAFFLTKLQGIETAEYKVEFLNLEFSDSTQYLQILDESQIKNEEARLEKHSCYPLARMKIVGTNAWYYWFQEKKKGF